MSNPKSRTTWRRIPKRASAVAKMLAAAPSAASREIVRSLAAVGIPRTVAAKTPKKDVIGLLQLAAELEHALMVQYLYAAASVHGPTPEGIDAGRDITIVAIQEMGHLVTVQNLLLAIADVDPQIPEPNHYHHLGRDRLRAKSKLNPIPFVLEPISHSGRCCSRARAARGGEPWDAWSRRNGSRWRAGAALEAPRRVGRDDAG